jgi:Hemagglutinin repeat
VVSQFIQYLRIVGMLCGLSTLSVSAQAIYPLKQPIVQVSSAQTAIEFIVYANTIQGSTIAPDRTTSQNTTTQTNSSSSSSTSAGVSMGIGQGNGAGAGPSFNIAASKGSGNGQGTEVTNTNTQVSGTRVNLNSGGNTTLQGAVITANTVNADIKGSLTITSLQDTSSFNETNRSSGGSISSGRTAINSN